MKLNNFMILIVLLLMMNCYSTNAACPTGYYLSNNICLPSSHKICPENSIYVNGVCKYRSSYLCPGNMTYSNGICSKMPVAIACSQAPQECILPSRCLSNNIKVCPQREICPQNTIMFNGKCVTDNIAQCPIGSTSENGYCLKNSTCPPGTYYYNGKCVDLPKTKVVECAPGSHKVGNDCVQNLNVVCPNGSVSIGGICTRAEPCPVGKFPYRGVCAECPVDTHYINGLCVKCKNGMMYENGTCICTAGKKLFGGECVYVETVKCPENEIPYNGKCIPRYCYGNRCCNDTICNDCFKKCEQLSETTSEMSECQKDCFNDIFPAQPPIITKPKPIENPPETNSNTPNIETKENNTNTNNVDPDSNGNANETVCCIITDGRSCEEIDGKYHCYQRKRHVCGSECDEKPVLPPEPTPSPTQPRPPPPIIISRPQPQPIYIQTPPLIQQPRPLILQPPPLIIQPPRQILVRKRPQIIPQPQMCTADYRWPYYKCFPVPNYRLY